MRNPASAEEKKNILIVGNLHAREFFSSKFVLKFCNAFLFSLDSDKGIYPSARELLGKYNIYVIPVANPDGLKIAQEDWKGIESHKSSIDCYISLAMLPISVKLDKRVKNRI